MTRHILSGLAVLVILPAAARAQDMPALYPQAELSSARQRFQSWFDKLWSRAIQPNLTPAEKQALTGVRFEFPLVGRHGDPFDYYSDANNRSVMLPVQSLLFWEDLSTAQAWLHLKGYNLEQVEDYVLVLRHRRPRDWKGGRVPPPLEALGIPKDALADKAVDELALRFRNRAFAFILGHELGHIVHRHPGYAPGVPRLQARANEEAADRFGLEILRRTSTIPVGAGLFLVNSARWFPSRVDFRTDQSWNDYLENEATHPLTAHRLREVAKRLLEAADDFVVNEPNKEVGLELVRDIADKLLEVARILEDPDLQRRIAERAATMDLSTLRERRPAQPR